jgi:hypothetical protein
MLNLVNKIPQTASPVICVIGRNDIFDIMANAEITVSYPVFYPVKKMYWSPDAINLVLIATALLAVLLPFSERINLALRQFFPALIIIHSIYRIFTMFSTHQTLKGIIHGQLHLKPLEIINDGKAIPVTDISKLKFSFFDYEGQRDTNYRSLNGQLSNGVNNSITIFLKNGTKRQIFFQRKNSDDMASIKPLLIEYYKKGLISFLDLTSLTCKSYKEVQELKAQL